MSVRPERRALERVRAAEAIRQALRRALRHFPQHLLAPLIGINRGSLRKVLAMSEPEPETCARLQHWFQDQPEPDVHPALIGLALLAKEFPFTHRLPARQHLTKTLLRLFEEAGEQPPPWLVEEYKAHRGRAKR